LTLSLYTIATNCTLGGTGDNNMRGAATAWWSALCGTKAGAKCAVYDCTAGRVVGM